MKVLPRYIIILMALLPILSAVSCNDDFDEFGEESLYDGGMFIYGSTDYTRAARTWWHSDDSIGISGNGYVNTQYRVDNSSNMESAKFKYYSGQEICYNSANRNRARYSAYYPFMGDTCVSPGIVYHETYDQSDSAQRTYDYLYDDTVNIKENVFFHFHHMMASVYLLFVTTEAEPASDSIGFILNNTFQCRGYFNTETGQAWAIGARETIVDSVTVPVGVFPTAQLILFPQDSLAADTSSLNFTVFTRDSVYRGNFYFPKLEAGNQYTYTVIIGTGSGGVWAYLNPWLPGPYGRPFGPHGRIYPWFGGPTGIGGGGLTDSLHPWIGGADGHQLYPFKHADVMPWKGGDHSHQGNLSDSVNLKPWGGGVHSYQGNLSDSVNLKPWSAGPIGVQYPLLDTTKIVPWNGGPLGVQDTLIDTAKIVPWSNGDSGYQKNLFDTSTITPWGPNISAHGLQDAAIAEIHPWGAGDVMYDFDSVYTNWFFNAWSQGQHTTDPFKMNIKPWDGGQTAFDQRVGSGSQTNAWRSAATKDSGEAYKKNAADTSYTFAWGHDTARAVSPSIPRVIRSSLAKQRFMTYLKRRLYLYNK